MKNYLSPIEEIIKEAKTGKMFILVDAEDRENEGDLVIPAVDATPDMVNFMAKYGRGLICLPLSEEKADHLNLKLMSDDNKSRHKTPFTVSIEAKEGISTGISAKDRSTTIQTAINPQAREEDIVTPGHIFPLKAKDGGVLVRAGHTEAAVDLCLVADHYPVAVICEIINDDGSMARIDDLIEFSAKHDVAIGTIKDLIEYRLKLSNPVSLVSSAKVPTDYGEFTAHVYKDNNDNTEHIALTYKDYLQGESSMVRVHSECLTGDVFSSNKCDCGYQLNNAMETIVKNGSGVILYMRGHEGRGIGLGNKIKAYSLQDEGADTVEANLKLGFEMDQRDYGTGALILRDLGITNMNLLTNNPNKRAGLEGFGLNIVKRTPLKGKITNENSSYLDTKENKMGHNFNEE